MKLTLLTIALALSTSAMAERLTLTQPYSFTVLKDIPVSGSVGQIYLHEGKIYDYRSEVPSTWSGGMQKIEGALCVLDVADYGHQDRTIQAGSTITGTVTIVETESRRVIWPEAENPWIFKMDCSIPKGLGRGTTFRDAYGGVLRNDHETYLE